MPGPDLRTPRAVPEVIDLGRLPYADAYARQVAAVDQVLAARATPAPSPGVIFLVEHDPVITVTRRPQAREHLLATPDLLARHGVALAETDRGGDVTYHGPGQIVAYPVLDLTPLALRVHDYMRLLEEAVIRTCDAFGVSARRDPTATGVWVNPKGADPGVISPGAAKIAAMGVRLRRWVTMHGLALNVKTKLDHFGLIVTCGLAGRPVTSLLRELGETCPGADVVKARLALELLSLIGAAGPG